MLPPSSKPLEVDRLADGAADVEFDVSLAQLPQLREGLTGRVRGHLRFGRDKGVAVAQIDLNGSATLECQRCMRPMERALDVHTRVALVASEAEAERVPADLEPVLAAGGRISVGELITEELLLSLPIVPLHEGAGECPAAPAEPGSETHRPFAGLAELLKR
ncbi:MAG TPA: YceD family protein [Steroidobacteraceae bacterium]|jgi:uncharacterized protein